MFHPATLLLAWAAFALALPALSLGLLVMLLIPALAAAAGVARSRTLTLLRRARWLLLSIALLFAFATPGVLVPGPLSALGITEDGLVLAGEHLARLVLLLATLALLHERLGTIGFVSGMHWLLAPLRPWRGLRERIVVRMMLVVELVESRERPGWRHWLEPGDVGGPASLSLAVSKPHWPDRLVFVLLSLAAVALLW